MRLYNHVAKSEEEEDFQRKNAIDTSDREIRGANVAETCPGSQSSRK